MKTRSLLLLLLAAVIALPPSAFAADKSREGFMLNLGFGLGKSTHGSDEVSYSGMASFVDFKIGGGVNEKVWIYLVDYCGFYSVDLPVVDLLTGQKIGETRVSLVQDFGGVGATYFFKTMAPSAFVQGAFGIAMLTETPLAQPGEVSGADVGYGFQVGVGFEVIPGFSAQVDFMRAGTKILNDMSGGIPGKHPRIKNVSFTVNWAFY